MLRQILSATVLVCVIVILIIAAPAASHYQLMQKFDLGGEGGWDYLTYDPSGKRLFISRATRVMVVNPSNGSEIADIPNTPGVHGIALADDLGKGFTSNGRENTVTVFDLKSLKETSRIKVTGQNPDAILYDSNSKRVFTFNGRSKDATVIDATNGSVAGTIPLGGKPEFAAADGRGMVFVNIEDKNEMVSIDAGKATVLGHWPLAGCEEPSGLAIDQQNHRLFAGCGNKVMAIVNSDSGTVITALPIGAGMDATAFDPATKLAFASNGGDGTLTVIHEDSPDKFSVVENATTQKFARTMAVNTANHEVYLVTADFEEAAPAAAGQRARRTMKPGTFRLLVMGKK